MSERSNNPSRVLLVLLVTIASCSPVAAQERSRTWLGIGLGGGGGRDGAEGLAVMAELAHQKYSHHVALRGVLLVDPYGTSADSLAELGFLYGRAAKRRWGHAAIATGLALTFVESCSSGTTGGCTTVGVPIVAEAGLRPTPVVGVGVQGFANLNQKTTFAGVVVFLQLGWMP